MKKFLVLPVALVVVLAFSGISFGASYAGSEACFKCHPEIYNDFRVSGHPYKIQKAETAKHWALPLPSGYSWSDISYVIGGATKKARYMDKNGYIITMTGKDRKTPGKNQYNLETGTWSDYSPGEKLQYKCGPCHMTAYSEKGRQDGLEGVVGTWEFPGIQCEECHGPGADHAKGGNKAKISIDRTAAACGKCHIRGAKETIPAKGGFMQHHEQYNELLAGPHKGLTCVTCHNPHKKAGFSVKAECNTCHGAQTSAYKGSSMEKVGVKCADCHMPKATKSAINKGPYEGDDMTHIFAINIDAGANMFYKDEKGEFAKGFVTLGFACLNCHKDKDVDWAASKAKGVHEYGR